jgi:hypothetical protein
MAKQHVKIIDGTIQIKSLLDWVYLGVSRGLSVGAVRVTLELEEENRTIEQNSKQWPMYNDLSKQAEWYGQMLTPYDWKDLLSNDWQAQRIVPAISGGLCALGVRTSKMKKREMSELIELIYHFGTEKGVKWSEKALECYESYKENQQ